MNRFFGKSENIFENEIIIDGSDVNHIKNVLRMKQGDKLLVAGGNNKEFVCSIGSFEDDRIILHIDSTSLTDRELPVKVTLFQGLPKGDKMEWIIQKCVELGVFEIVPVSMKRCVVKLDEKKAKGKVSRWQSISESGAKQCGRNIVPKISEVMSFNKAMEYAKGLDMVIVPYELCEGMDATQKALSSIKPGMNVGVFIGPEGGFDISEIELSKALGFTPVSLGKRILRTETAGMTVMAILMYHLEIQE